MSTWADLNQEPSVLAPGINSASMSAGDLILPAGWRMHAGSPPTTQDEVDQFIDNYYRTGPGANLAAQNFPMHIAAGVWNPGAATSAKSAYMAEHPNFETQPFVPGGGAAGRQAAIDALLGTARTGIQSAFTAYGADPKTYEKDIEDRLAAIVAGIPPTAKEYNTFFPSDLGTKLITDLETGRRNKLLGEYETGVTNDFIPLTSDDAFIDTILGEDRATADKFIANALARGQMNTQGAETAKTDLDRQAVLGKTRLGEIGGGLINAKEAELDAERAKRKTGISSLKLTDPFDIGTQSTDLGKLATDFISTLPTGIRAGIGDTPLFSTAGFGSFGGFGGGGGGTGGTAPPVTEEDEELLKTGNEVLF